MRDPRYVSTVAAFKEGGTTPARICTNFSAGKLSENDTALTGKIQINLEKTCRSFKANSHVASLDVKKFFHQVSLSTEDIARHLFIWRHNLDPANPPETYCFIRLCFGHTSSSLISEEAVRKITRFGELVCTHCAGNYSESSLLSTFNTAQLGACPGVSHHLARLVKRMYVDDLIIATSSQNNLTLLVNYATALFNLFGFAFKEANIVHQGGSTPPQARFSIHGVRLASHPRLNDSSALSSSSTCSLRVESGGSPRSIRPGVLRVGSVRSTYSLQSVRPRGLRVGSTYSLRPVRPSDPWDGCTTRPGPESSTLRNGGRARVQVGAQNRYCENKAPHNI